MSVVNDMLESESLRQQLSDSQKQVTQLRDTIDKAATQIKRCDYTPARSLLLQALAATEPERKQNDN